jgi:hypothetical protein
MDADDFLDEEVQSNVQRYEKMLRNKTREFFEAEALEDICDYYIQKEKLKKLNNDNSILRNEKQQLEMLVNKLT